MPQSGAPSPRQPVRPFLVSVKHVTDITPALRRICFTNPLLANYPDVSGGAHIKIMMAHGDQTVPVLPTLTDKGPRWLIPEEKPLIRTFSVRAFRRDTCEIDIDFALHADSGPATRFAQRAQEGDVLAISGPGGPHPMLQPAKHYYMAGDLTALPAISAMIEDMPADSTGYIALLVPHSHAIQDLPVPDKVTVTWVIGSPVDSNKLTVPFLQQDMKDTNSYFWFGGEENIVVPLRNHVRRNMDVARTDIYAVPYWRNGKDEDAYHQNRHTVMDS
ncbi:siderophore-interacting protein [Photobacterium indicum]|uniref:Siderophore-interacting protein n=1 Tax=Photobacterium indicum TaxID=81447 RepID=A0A2T3L6U8_9GAMM|nr:siderophore-interacting protein [Photobacterium indicum]PSV46113.1 siderophore-interacting protein [Photobacterium indicum]